jgi:hypothetical protein
LSKPPKQWKLSVRLKISLLRKLLEGSLSSLRRLPEFLESRSLRELREHLVSREVRRLS